MEEQIEALIGSDLDRVPLLLRALSTVAKKRYEDFSRKAFNDPLFHFSGFEELPRALRREHDIAMAWMSLNLEYLAQSWEERMQMAGMSNAERCERDKAKKVAELERHLEYVKSRKCV
jgi:hypothetical protein